jgi:trans-aconitate 2-methyltransferase
MWDVGQFLKFEAERTRPYWDLMAQVQVSEPERIVDLGCGPGNLTRLLAERWPNALVTGIDSSAEMLSAANRLAIAGRLEFAQADIAEWSPTQSVNLIVSNSAWQWVPDHERMIDHCRKVLAPGGTLAVQMPCRFGTSSQTIIDEVAADSRWADRLRGVGLHRHSVQTLGWYAEQLCRRGMNVNAWETAYLHALTGENPVLEWLRGTALRPLLGRLEQPEQQEFVALLGGKLQAAYPPCGDVTFFPMPRLFFVATTC